MKVFVNLSMLSDFPTGVGGYCKHIYAQLKKRNGGVDFSFLKISNLTSLQRLLWNMFVLPFRVKSDIVYSPSTHGSVFIPKQIITIHDLIALNFPHQYRFQYYYFRLLVPLLVKRSLKIIAISEFTKSELIKHYRIDPEKIKVIYNGSNRLSVHHSEAIKKELEKITKGKPYFVTIGANYEHKNIINLIEAVKIFNNSDYEFIIAGKDNACFQQVKKRAADYGLTNITFLNYISDEMLPSLYQEAIANVYVSRYEGFGFPPMEAASVGTVSVVSDIPVMREVYEDCVYYVDPDKPRSIAEGLQCISRDEPMRKTLLLKSEMLFTKYSWEKCAEEIEQLIRQTELK